MEMILIKLKAENVNGLKDSYKKNTPSWLTNNRAFSLTWPTAILVY